MFSHVVQMDPQTGRFANETIENQKNGLPCTVAADLLPPFYQSIQDCRSPDKKQWICTKNDNATKQI